MLRFTSRAVALVAATGLASGFGALGLGGTPSAQAAQSDNIRASQQWVLSAVDASAAWAQAEGAGVTVAVLDSGVNGSVSDLSGSVTSGPDLTGLKTPPSNANWGVHGTWMASIIAGHGHDGGNDGIMGIAPEARILSIRVIPEKTDPEYKTYNNEPEQRVQQSLATGIRDAVKDGAQVISMSLGYTTPSAVVRSAVQYAFDHGVVLLASSGNSGKNDSSGAASTSSGSSPVIFSTSAVSEAAAGSAGASGSAASAGSAAPGSGFAPASFPAEYPGVLSVAALQQDGSVASFSSNNLSVRVGAPGDNVPAEGRDGGYWLVSGTSPACAVTAGVAALIKSKYRNLSPADVDQALTSTAQNQPSGSYNAQSGFGEVNASAALDKAAALVSAKSAGSQVASTVRFGGGASADPAPPVPPRGTGSLVLYAIVAALSLVIVSGAGLRIRASRRGGVPARDYGPSGTGPPGSRPAPGYPPPSYPRQSPAYPRPGGYGQSGAYPGRADGQDRGSVPYGYGQGYGNGQGYGYGYGDDPGGNG